MNEEVIPAAVRRNETKALFGVEPLIAPTPITESLLLKFTHGNTGIQCEALPAPAHVIGPMTPSPSAQKAGLRCKYPGSRARSGPDPRPDGPSPAALALRTAFVLRSEVSHRSQRAGGPGPRPVGPAPTPPHRRLAPEPTPGPLMGAAALPAGFENLGQQHGREGNEEDGLDERPQPVGEDRPAPRTG